MRTIAIVKVSWFISYCHEADFESLNPYFISNLEWREVSEEEYLEISKFIYEKIRNSYSSKEQYVIFEKVSSISFDEEFSAWKETKKIIEEKDRLRKEKEELNRRQKEEKKKNKELEKAKKILEKEGLKVVKK